ncbi:MAG TPA: prepilin-type N-terminal cleavage/methylation domain-containing protein [bacterium]|nr:prepilin-type N-terminal cleavage/methylation domain-containing protein [bacterium]
MRTFPARTSSRPAAAGGFTLIELLLVMALMAVVLVIALPAFQSLLQSTLQQEVNHTTGVIRLLRNEAVLSNTRYRLMLNVKGSRYSIERQNELGTYDPVQEPRELAPHRFPSGMVVQDLVLLGHTYDTHEADPVPIVIDASGYVDPFLLHFRLDDKDYTLRISGFTGRVELLDGHVDH